MAELERVGVQGSGVRMQRFDDGSTLRDLPGLFKYGFVFDPWGTRIELVEDAETLGYVNSAPSGRSPWWSIHPMAGSHRDGRGAGAAARART